MNSPGRRWLLVAVAVSTTAVVVGAVLVVTANRTTTPRRVHRQRGQNPGTVLVQPGSDASVLPGPVLIADRGNNRLLEIDPLGRTL